MKITIDEETAKELLIELEHSWISPERTKLYDLVRACQKLTSKGQDVHNKIRRTSGKKKARKGSRRSSRANVR